MNECSLLWSLLVTYVVFIIIICVVYMLFYLSKIQEHKYGQPNPTPHPAGALRSKRQQSQWQREAATIARSGNNRMEGPAPCGSEAPAAKCSAVLPMGRLAPEDLQLPRLPMRRGEAGMGRGRDGTRRLQEHLCTFANMYFKCVAKHARNNKHKSYAQKCDLYVLCLSVIVVISCFVFVCVTICVCLWRHAFGFCFCFIYWTVYPLPDMLIGCINNCMCCNIHFILIQNILIETCTTHSINCLAARARANAREAWSKQTN